MLSKLDRYLLQKFLGRWIIVNAANHILGWTGSRWVMFSDLSDLCNFETPNGAHFYAHGVGLVPVESVA